MCYCVQVHKCTRNCTLGNCDFINHNLQTVLRNTTNMYMYIHWEKETSKLMAMWRLCPTPMWDNWTWCALTRNWSVTAPPVSYSTFQARTETHHRYPNTPHWQLSWMNLRLSTVSYRKQLWKPFMSSLDKTLRRIDHDPDNMCEEPVHQSCSSGHFSRLFITKAGPEKMPSQWNPHRFLTSREKAQGCNWVLEFLTGIPQGSQNIWTSTGSPWDYVLNPMLYTLLTYNCVAS